MCRHIVSFFVVVVCLSGLITASAQRTTGSLTGTVVDPNGLAINAAKVSLTDKERGIKLSVTTSSEGTYFVPDLVPGRYDLSVQKDGFKTFATIVTIVVGVTTSISPKLELGQVSSIVEVKESALTVDTSQSSVQGLITSSQIERLPLNGRNFLDLATQEPGVQTVDGGNFDPTKNQMVGVSIGGRSGRSTRIQVDGVDITDETVGTTTTNLSNESIQEFGISQSSLDVSTDLTSSGGVNIITKSGTNVIHGSGFGFFRDAGYAADQRLDKTVPTTEKPPFQRRNFGGRLGGPFFKDKLFWQLDYEGNRQNAQRFVNTPNFAQFTGNFGVPLTENIGSGRLDWVLNNKLNGFYRFQHDDNVAVTGFGGISLSAFSNLNNTNFHVVGADYRTGHWIHGFRFAYVNLPGERRPQPSRTSANLPR